MIIWAWRQNDFDYFGLTIWHWCLTNSKDDIHVKLVDVSALIFKEKYRENKFVASCFLNFWYSVIGSLINFEDDVLQISGKVHLWGRCDILLLEINLEYNDFDFFDFWRLWKYFYNFEWIFDLDVRRKFNLGRIFITSALIWDLRLANFKDNAIEVNGF